MTVTPRKKKPQDDTRVQEYSDTFISIRQSRVSDCLDQIDLTPSVMKLSHHDYTNVDLPEEEGASSNCNVAPVRQKPDKPPPFKPKPGSSPASNDSFSPPLSPPPPIPLSSSPAFQSNHLHSPVLSRHGRTASPSQSPKPPARSGPSPSNSPKNLRRVGASPSSSPKPPIRDSYDVPYQLKTKPPPTKKKPTLVLSKTKAGTYDDPDEVLAYKKAKPKKPSREGIIVTRSVDEVDGEDADYDDPEEGVYNTAEAVYDESGFNTTEVGTPPNFDDGIYMSGGGGMHNEAGGIGNTSEFMNSSAGCCVKSVGYGVIFHSSVVCHLCYLLGIATHKYSLTNCMYV